MFAHCYKYSTCTLNSDSSSSRRFMIDSMFSVVCELEVTLKKAGVIASEI